MAVPTDPELLKAQYSAFSKQVPLLYGMLLVNTWALAATHFQAVPRYLALYFPLLLTAICLARLVCWLRSSGKNVSIDKARRRLVQTNRLAVILAAAFSWWAISLFPYGDVAMQGHTAFYMGLTTIGCIFCLMHLRSAAVIVAVVVNLAFIVFFGAVGNPVFTAKAINVALVSITLLFMLQVYYRDFSNMVASQRRTQALSDENFRLATIDSLTSLPNRRRFFSELHVRFERARQTGRRLAVGVLDLDGFKPVNDVHGHTVGDMLLVQVGDRIRSVCADRALACRLGGDEFALIVDDVQDDALLMALGERVCAMLRQPVLLDGARVQVAATIGFAIYPDRAEDAEALFENADYALYEGKRSHRGNAILFSEQHDADIRRNARIEQALMHADFAAELSVHFQPIVDIRQGRVVALEALARWHSPQLGNVSPADFVPMAERIGMIGAVTRVLLRKALVLFQQWPEPLRLSFNLSAHDTQSRDTVGQLLDIIASSGVAPSRIDLEITETAMMSDVGQARDAVQLIKAAGCGLSLDDFGTGYSSLTQLHSWPLSKIKIDRRFVTDIQHNAASYKIVRSLLTLSTDMQIGCVVEGVETQAQLDILRQLGCELVQGFVFSRPLPAEDVTVFLASGAWLRQG